MSSLHVFPPPPFRPAPAAPALFPGQALLLAVAPGPRGPAGTVIGTVGAQARRELDDSSPRVDDLLMDGDGDWPRSPGFHVWEGTIRVVGGWATWIGAWRPATGADFAVFGVDLP